MAIADMNEFTLLTFEVLKDCLLKELQRFGGVQFKSADDAGLAGLDFLRRPDGQDGGFCEGEIARIQAALEKIRPYRKAPKGLKAMAVPPPSLRYEEFDAWLDQYDYRSVCEAIRVKSEELAALGAERNRLTAERTVWLGWSGLDVTTPLLNSLKTVKPVTGTVGKALEERFFADFSLRFPASWAECAGHTREDACLLLLIHADEYDEAGNFLKDAGFNRVPLTFPEPVPRLLESNREALDRIGTREQAAREGIGAYARDYEKLSIALDCFKSALRRRQAAEHFLGLHDVVVISGWAPAEGMEALRGCLSRACGDDWYLEDKPAERDSEDVPIKLENNRLVSAFEDVTSMFALPRYNEMDPTPLMTPFYMLFFGLMVGDMGYGLLLAAGTLIALKLFRLKPGGRRFMRFFFWLGLATMVVGLLYGGAFGVTVFAPLRTPGGEPKAILDPISNAKDDIVLMMILSVAIGTVQVLLGLIVKGIALLRVGKILDAVYDSLLWILATASGLLMILSAAIALPAMVGSVSLWVFLLSIAGLLITQGRDSPGIGGKIGNGLLGTYGLSGIAGDLISYTRLTALALSGAYITFSFIKIASLMPAGAVRTIAGGLIIVIGQTLNLGLAALGGYVHTCRLQYVEFFGKFYEGGGRPFRPLTLQCDFVDIVE